MKGLQLAREFYEQCGRPMLDREFPQYKKDMAAGLVGEGSECFGFDDAISRDHDFGARFCLWIPSDIYQEAGACMQQACDDLAEKTGLFRGEAVISGRAAGGAKRSGVFAVDDFYRQILHGVPLPQKEEDWFAFRESALAAATNGEVFSDPSGDFTKIRQILQAYYPENVRLKKLAVCLLYMAQTGQVNYARCMSRGSYLAADICIGEFTRAALSALYLLNRRFMPFYKWAAAGLQGTSVLPEGTALLTELQDLERQQKAWQVCSRPGTERAPYAADRLNTEDRKVCLIEETCRQIREELYRQELSDHPGDFLAAQAEQVHRRITDEAIRKFPLQMPEYTAS